MCKLGMKQVTLEQVNTLSRGSLNTNDQLDWSLFYI